MMKKLSGNDKKRYSFKGTFRNYQARVLADAEIHLADNRVHIVAAPGSGKTILGLELIFRIGEPALVLSPTLSIRNQWKQRFTESFTDNQNADDIVSTSLKDIKFITSITYQTLHSALNKLSSCRAINSKDSEEGDTDSENNESGQDVLNQWDDLCDNEDYNNFEILKAIKKAGVKTICLDEAHHLRLEWQKSLENFLSKLDKDYKIIALTATPPYDANKYEWDKYISVCGEIDDEIFVPELVKEKNLCYHQDYIYFNYPGQHELNAIYEFDARIDRFVDELFNEGLLYRLANENLVFKDPDKYLDICFDDEEDFIGFLNLLDYSSEYIPADIISIFLSQNNRIPVDAGFQFILNHKELFNEDLYDTIIKKLKEAKLIERNKVRIIFDKKINNLMIQSVGKLQSIKEICNAEFNAMGNNLRMLILGDYIRKNYLNDIGTENSFTQIGIVPIFETVRRSLGTSAKIGVLTGSLIILPEITLNEIRSIAEKNGVSFKCTQIIEGYVIIDNVNKSSAMVSIITGAFQMGLIEILIGTKSLLGEGWDSPNINSLILASFVGSYVLSNQMRGRAIRIDPIYKDKSANIWHLVTVNPPHLFKNKLMSGEKSWFGDPLSGSNDFITLKRRFKTFVGPHYSKNSIENGIERIDIITPPFDKEGFNRINNIMLQLAADREGMAQKWKKALGEETNNKKANYEMQKQVRIKKKKIPEIRFINHLNSIFVTASLLIYYYVLRSIVFRSIFTGNPMFLLSGFVAANVQLAFSIKSKVFFARITSPKRRLKIQSEAILKTFIYMGVIKSEDVKVKVESNGIDDFITISLVGGTAHEKEIFAAALKEMAAPIQRQKYLLIHKSKKKIKKYLLATPCPELIARKREYVDFLQKEFKRKMLPYDVIHTRNAEGREILLKVRKLSLKSIDTALSECIERFVSK